MAKQKESVFKIAVDDTPDVAGKSRSGLQALGSHSSKIELAQPKDAEGSLNLDDATTPLYPQASRWDYVVSVKGECYFIEVHSANSSEVSAVIAKLAWLKTWLVQRAPKIYALRATHVTPYYWVQSNGFDIPKHSRQYRMAAAAGLLPVKKLRFK